MKTRIFTTVAMLILASNLIAGTTYRIEKDTTTVLAYAAYEKSSFEIRSENSVVISEAIHVNNADILENWVATRESWEQEGSEAETGNLLMEAVNLEEWISGMESWEQEGEPGNSDLMETVNLEEWIVSRESWEQKGSDNEMTTFLGQSDILGIWISERENWERK